MTENRELISRMKQGDKRAEAELIENNMGLVYSIAGRMSSRSCDTEDIVQIGALGLVKAVKKFDESYGVMFSTYAVPMIIGEIKRFFRDDGAVKVSRSLKEAYLKGRRAEERLCRKLGRTPTISETASEAGIDEGILIEAFDAASMPGSLNEKTGDEGLSLEDRLASDDTEEKIVDKVFVREALSALGERERRIMVMRYFKGKTQAEVARYIGVSQVQISRIEKKAIETIREKLDIERS